MKSPLFVALTAVVALAACSKSEEPKAAAQAPAAPAAAPAAGPAAQPVVALNTGKIAQIQRAGIYTYAEVQVTEGRTVWIAGGNLDAQAGDTVQWGDAAIMRNFTAKSLNRTFPEILFVSQWAKVGGEPAKMVAHGTPGGAGPVGTPPNHPPMAGHPPMGNQAPMGMAPVAAGGGNSGMVKSVASAGGYTYLEVDQGGQTIWVAAPENPAIKAGKEVTWAPGPVMSNFTAKSLGRTFDRIVFAGSANVK